MRRDPVQHGCPDLQNWLDPRQFKHSTHLCKNRREALYEQERAPYLNRYGVVYRRAHAIHIQPPQLIEKTGQFLVYSWSGSENTNN